MSAYIYAISDKISQQVLMTYASNCFQNMQLVVEKSEATANWEDRTLGKILTEAKSGDSIVVFDALHIVPSHMQILDFLQACLNKNIDVHFVKYDTVFKAQTQSKFADLCNLFRQIEADYVSKRNQESIAKRQEYGIVLGRPKGRKNKALKLDKFKKDIMRYLELSISKASIAKLVECHPQTLYDWIDRNQLIDQKARRTRAKKRVELA